ncbi:alpha/beta fold hydrolase [Liquorilactobacillus satsumensis]|uniref:alpha/beta fold hydrolase n=1 Tax=Liquorilactobacillus satsumensis TaxID=259059 RepID=UPI0039E8E9A8
MKLRICDKLINYEVIGSGRPVVVLCLNHTLMKTCFERIPCLQKFQRIYLDIPGTGASSAFYQPHPSSDYLLHLLLLALKRLVSEPFYLCGYSYAGYLALGITTYFENNIKGLFLVCPVVIAAVNQRKLAGIQQNHFTSKKRAADVWYQHLRSLDYATKEVDLHFWQSLQCQNYKYYRLSVEPALKKIQIAVPTLFLLGKRDNIVGYEDQVRLSNSFSNIALAILNDAGHKLLLCKKHQFLFYAAHFFKH